MQRSSSLVSMMSSGSKLDELPEWDPLSVTSKKEVARDRLAASLVHLIPLLMILCAVLLWLFSYPEVKTAKASRLVMAKNLTAFEH